MCIDWDIRLKALRVTGRPNASTKQPQTALLTKLPWVNTVRNKTNGLSWHGIGKELEFIACNVQIIFLVNTPSELC